MYLKRFWFATNLFFALIFFHQVLFASKTKNSFSALPFNNIDETLLNKLYNSAIDLQFKNPDSALILAKTSIQLAHQLKVPIKAAEMDILIGKILENQGNYELAIDYILSALIIYTNLDMKPNIATTQNLLGHTYSEAYMSELGLPYLMQTLKFASQTDDKLLLMATLCNIGYAYERLDKPLKALKYYHEADSINVQIKDPNLDLIITEAFASINEDLAIYEKAMFYYRKVEKLVGDDLFERMDVINNIGDNYRKSGNPEKALAYYQEAYRIAIEKKIQRKEEENLRDIALTYEALGNEQMALSYFKKHLELFRKIFDQHKASNMSQLLILYETDRKNKEIELQKSIAKANLLQRNLLIGGLVVFVFLSIWFYINYRQKNQLNSILNQQNEKINKQHEILEITNHELNATINKLHEAQKQLIHSEKLATMGSLAAGIAHEINNPLNFIQGGITAIDIYLDENLKDHKEILNTYLEWSYTGIERATKIVTSLNHMSRSNDKMDEVCDIHTIIDNCLLMIQNKIKDHIEIEKDFYNQPLISIGNDGKLHQVVLNILTNASQAIHGKGKIVIKTKIENVHNRICILDTGIGIPKENLDHIFEPFYTTKEVGKGTGLGLSISNSIIKAHHGSLQIESEVNVGTKATILLPKA